MKCDTDKSKVAVLGGRDHTVGKRGREVLKHAESMRWCPLHGA